MPKSPPGRAVPPRGGYGRRGVSRRLAVIGSQQSTETLNADDLTLVSCVLRFDDLVEALVNPLVMIVLEVLSRMAVP